MMKQLATISQIVLYFGAISVGMRGIDSLRGRGLLPPERTAIVSNLSQLTKPGSRDKNMYKKEKRTRKKRSLSIVRPQAQGLGVVLDAHEPTVGTQSGPVHQSRSANTLFLLSDPIVPEQRETQSGPVHQAEPSLHSILIRTLILMVEGCKKYEELIEKQKTCLEWQKGLLEFHASLKANEQLIASSSDILELMQGCMSTIQTQIDIKTGEISQLNEELSLIKREILHLANRSM